MSKPAALLLAVAVLSGCGGGGLRGDLAATGGNMGKIRAGVIDFSLLVTPRAHKANNPFGWKLKGPFSFGDVPTARVTYTQIANGHTADDTLVLDKSGGYVMAGGKRRSLTDANLSELRGSAARVRAGASIDISKWIKSASSCGARCAQGNLDMAEAANTLIQISGSKQTLTDAETKQLAGATRAATYRVEWTDKHLMRKLQLHVDLGFRAPPKLEAALGKLVGATFDLRMGLQHPQA